MAITLAQMQENADNKLVPGFINELITDSYLLSAMTFDDCISTNGQSNLAYSYKRVKTPASAAFRKLNEEGTASQAEIERVHTSIAILNSTFTIDRVAAAAAGDLLALDLEEAKNSIIRMFNDAVINGDTTVEEDGFDGLTKILRGSSTEMVSGVDVSTAQKMTDNAMAWADDMDTFLSLLNGDPACLLVGKPMKTKLSGIGRRLGKYQLETDNVGRRMAYWDGIPIVEMTDGAIKTNAIYAVRLGMQDFHGITLSGGNGITVNPPQLNTPGAVKIGDAEFVVGCALKATKSAGVMYPLGTVLPDPEGDDSNG